MRQSEVIGKIQEVAHHVLPKGSTLYLYGSRARGDYREDSDWDLLALLPERNISKDDKLNLSCDFWEEGQRINQDFNTFVYTQNEWSSAPASLFKYNVRNEGVKIGIWVILQAEARSEPFCTKGSERIQNFQVKFAAR